MPLSSRLLRSMCLYGLVLGEATAVAAVAGGKIPAGKFRVINFTRETIRRDFCELSNVGLATYPLAYHKKAPGI